MCAAALAACATLPPVDTTGGYARGGSGGGGPLRGTDKPYEIDGHWYVPHAQPHYDEVGVASWYGPTFHQRHTADGEIFDQNAVSAAHKTLPLPSIIEVTNLSNGRHIRVRLNDRGPFVGGRILDLSYGAAQELGFDRKGLAKVRVRYVGPAPINETAALAPRRRAPEYESPPVEPAPSFEPPPDDQQPPSQPPSDAGSLAFPPLAQPPEADPTPAPAPPAPEPVSEPAPDLRPVSYSVRVAAFSSRANAERAAAQLRDAGPCEIEPVQRGDAQLYRVVMNGFDSADSASAAQSRAAAAGYADAQVVKPF